MSYAAIIQGLEERLRNVAGIHLVLDYEPTSIEAFTVVSVFDRFERDSRGQKTAMTYYTMHTLAVRWQDNEQAERQLRAFINSVPAAIDADPTLSNRCNIAQITGGRADFAVVGGITYRVIDFESKVLEKAEWQSGI